MFALSANERGLRTAGSGLEGEEGVGGGGEVGVPVASVGSVIGRTTNFVVPTSTKRLIVSMTASQPTGTSVDGSRSGRRRASWASRTSGGSSSE